MHSIWVECATVCHELSAVLLVLKSASIAFPYDAPVRGVILFGFRPEAGVALSINVQSKCRVLHILKPEPISLNVILDNFPFCCIAQVPTCANFAAFFLVEPAFNVVAGVANWTDSEETLWNL